MKRFRKAFLNIAVDTPLSDEQVKTGNRHPDDPDRVACRQTLVGAVKKVEGVHGGQLMPHEMVEKLMEFPHFTSDARHPNQDEIDLFQAQWSDMKKKVQANLDSTSTAAPGERKNVDLGRLVPMCDVSGSMSGTPMIVAIALSLLVCEINHPAFRDRMLTFSAMPTWVDFQGVNGLFNRVKKTMGADWDMNTNILQAFYLILAVVEQHKLQQEDIPDLIIFTDMQFDAASEGTPKDTKTTFELLKGMFREAGLRTPGKPFDVPKIIFWNLRGDTKTVPVLKDEKNVQCLSGFSPSMLKCVLQNSMDDLSPLSTYLSALADATYDRVRSLLKSEEVNEGLLAEYK